VTFNAWFAALPLLLKILVVLGIVVGSFLVATSFVASTLSAWKYLGGILSRRDKDKEDKN
jgi:hypothetical protein